MRVFEVSNAGIVKKDCLSIANYTDNVNQSKQSIHLHSTKQL